MKKIILIPALAILLVSCTNNKESLAKLDEFTNQANTEAQNKAVVQKYLEGLNKNDTSLYEQLYAQVYSPECKLYAPAGSPTSLNYSEMMKMQKATYIGVPDTRWEIVDMAAEGNTVFVRLWTTGTHTGVYNGIPPTGKKFGFSNTCTFKLENGKITEQREDFDQVPILLQLGFEINPPAMKK